MSLKDRYYSPYKIGKRLYKDGYGISDIWSAVQSDADMEEAFRGYNEAKAKADAREDLKMLQSKLGYSRIGRNNV
jgi:hypothetical protein